MSYDPSLFQSCGANRLQRTLIRPWKKAMKNRLWPQ